MAELFQVKNWDFHYENDRSRTRDRCSFVCIPNKQHGMSFSYLMQEPDATMIYGVFHLITGACSQQRNPRQGWLTSDGTKSGEPWKAADLAVKFRRPMDEIKRALEILCSPKIDWIILHKVNNLESKSPSSHRQVTEDSPPTHLEGKGREGNRKEEKEVVYSPDSIAILYFLNEKSGSAFRQSETSLAPINARLSEPDVTIEEVKKMIVRQFQLWKGTRFVEYMRPSTLFGKEKFNEYYAARNQPINRSDAVKVNPRNEHVVRGPTDYAKPGLKPRFQREQEARDAELALKVASNEGNSPATGNGPG